jgi:hypothetical protein
VTFYKAESRLEQITSGPHAIFGGKEAKSDQAANLFVEFMRFFRGLLSSAYHFTDEQMQGLAHGKQTDRQTVFHGPVTNDDFRGVCWMVMSRAEDSIEMFAAVSKPLDGNEWTRLTDFQQESQVLEYKSQEKERAKGF